MRYPNLRYGNPAEFAYYVQGMSIKSIAKEFKRSERSVKDWLSGVRKIPWWVPEVARLWHLEHRRQMYEMGMQPLAEKFGFATGSVISFPAKPSVVSSVDPAPAFDIPLLKYK